MNKFETQQLLTILKTSYPNTYKDMTQQQATDTVLHYYTFFGEYPTPIVVQALKNYIKKNEYPPTIAGLQRQIDLLLHEGDSDVELWNLIHKACQNAMYHSKEEFNKLPTVCQRWVGRPEQLMEFAKIDSTTLNTVTRGQFLKSIKEIKENVSATESLPQELKNKIDIGHMFQLSMNERQEA